jgi:hypothetical protein
MVEWIAAQIINCTIFGNVLLLKNNVFRVYYEDLKPSFVHFHVAPSEEAVASFSLRLGS